MVEVSRRRWFFGTLVVAFFVQTLLVYSDPAGRRTPPLSSLAREGQSLWLRHNCQSCHQIHGFGGFLGPDLTNAAPSLTEARMERMLTGGAGQMPAFHLAADQRSALLQFLVEIDKTGISQPRVAPKLPPDELLDLLVAKAELSAAESEGLAILRKEKCIACHLPNHGSAVRAPDLTTALGRLGKEKVLQTLANGVQGTVMPKLKLGEAEQEGIIAFLDWLQANRDQAARVFSVTRPGGGSLLSIPWWEYGE